MARDFFAQSGKILPLLFTAVDEGCNAPKKVRRIFGNVGTASH